MEIESPMISTLGSSAEAKKGRLNDAKRTRSKVRRFIVFNGKVLIPERADGFSCLELGTDAVVVAGHIVKGLGRTSLAEAKLEGYAVSALRPVRAFEGKGVDYSRDLLTGSESYG